MYKPTWLGQEIQYVAILYYCNPHKLYYCKTVPQKHSSLTDVNILYYLSLENKSHNRLLLLGVAILPYIQLYVLFWSHNIETIFYYIQLHVLFCSHNIETMC